MRTYPSPERPVLRWQLVSGNKLRSATQEEVAVNHALDSTLTGIYGEVRAITDHKFIGSNCFYQGR